MRLEPVYVLAPKPKPSTIATRRAFLLAGGTLLAGMGIGGVCGYAIGAPGAGRKGGIDERAGQLALQPTGDPELDKLRRLAVEAPVDELMSQAMLFLDVLHDSYPSDAILWLGGERIAVELISNESRGGRRVTARWLLQVIDGALPGTNKRLLRYVPALQGISK